MSNIRRQSIISTLVIYVGFAVGLLNIYLFTRQGLFLDSQFGLYNAFIAISLMMAAVANLAMPSYIYKFYPYYKDHLPAKKNDQLTLAVVTGITGFILVVAAGIIFKGLVVKKYITNAPEIIIYYNWIFVLALGLLIFNILEAYAWQLHKSVFTNFLKEVAWRLFTTVLIVLFSLGIIEQFDVFIRIFSFSYPFIAALLLIYLIAAKKIHFTFTISKVTRRLSRSIVRLCAFIYTGSLIFTISVVFDSLVITSKLENALAQLAVYSLAQNIASMIQVPQRGVIAASMAHLSQGWKDRNMGLIKRIYQRSSINQLLFACGFFGLVVLSFTDVVTTFHLKETYLDAFYVVIFLGLAKVIDMGTGVNAQIIATSVYWKFEMISGIILLLLMLPLSYLFTVEFGIAGTGAAQLISITLYNAIRILFLWVKFRLQPFTRQTFYTLLLGAFAFSAVYFGLSEIHGLMGILLRSLIFLIIYGGGAIILKLSPDIAPVITSLKKRMGIE